MPGPACSPPPLNRLSSTQSIQWRRFQLRPLSRQLPQFHHPESRPRVAPRLGGPLLTMTDGGCVSTPRKTRLPNRRISERFLVLNEAPFLKCCAKKTSILTQKMEVDRLLKGPRAESLILKKPCPTGEKALFFASTCGSDGKEKVLSNSWLEKFKQKNGLLGAKVRKGSFGAKSDSESPTGLSINSALASAVHSPSVLSPISPTGFVSPSPLSPAQSHENIRGSISLGPTDLGIDFQHSHSRSTISLDTTASFSPTSTLLTESPFTPSSQSRISPTDMNSSRPRSQTFPLTNADPLSMPTDDSSEPTSTMKGLLPAAMEDAVGEDHDQKVALNIDTSPGTIKRNRSNPDIRARTIYPPSYSRSTTVSPISSPGSPTQDEARKALELVVNYFEHQSSGLGAQEAVTIGKLLERLQLAQQPPTLPGGLTRIDEHDDASPLDQSSLTKKRSIHNMG
ncbi:hypothetical protein BDW72DRAFT_70926 [Aspergillus terricola var. indicus]